MQTNRSTTPTKHNEYSKAAGDPCRDLLRQLTTLRWDLRNGVRKNVCPEHFGPSIARVFDAMDASIGDLQAIIRARALPSQITLGKDFR